MMTQTLAILHDAYRELNSKKMFWIVLALSGLVVLAFAMLGLDEEGIQILWWTIPVNSFNTNVISEETFYELTFNNLGIGIWLTWAAMILALVSTASMIPDFVSSGSIDLMLSKPIGRLRLFFTKYLAGLLFVTLQVTIFTVCSFLVIGVRGGAWQPAMFLAIPIVVVFFSYLFSICVLLGLLTRSTIAALLLTILAWFLAFALNSTEQVFLQLRIEREMSVARGEQQVEVRRQRVEEMREELALLPDAPPEEDSAEEADPEADSSEGETLTERQRLQMRLERMSAQLESKQDQLEKDRTSLVTWTKVHRYSYAGKTLLPKTGETVALLDRALITLDDKRSIFDASREAAEDEIDAADVDPYDMSLEFERRLRERSVVWVIGTSLGVEVVMLGLAGWIFCRRDF